MGNRKGLNKGYVLNGSKNEKFIIDREIGRGSSCIVYDGIYKDALNLKHQVRIKECYPISLNLQRNINGELTSDNESTFELEKNKFVNTYKENVSFKFAEGFTNSSSNATMIIEFNNTLYTILDYQEGTTYDRVIETNLNDLIKTVLSVAKLIKKYHDNNYLYLDLKPDNVLIMPESREQVVLFDFDSLWRTDKEINKGCISYSEGFSAPEQCKGYLNKIGKHSDVYAVGALLYYKLFDKHPTIDDSLLNAVYDYSKVSRIDINAYSSLVQEYLTIFFRKTLASSIYARWNSMTPAIDLLEKILQAATVTMLMKNFLVEYTTRKPSFNLEIAEKELDELNCETEWQYMNTMDEIVSKKVFELLDSNSKILVDYKEQYRIIYEEIEKFFMNLIEEESLSQEIQNMVIKCSRELLKYIDKNIDLSELSLIKIQVQQAKPRKIKYLDLGKKDTLWTTLFGKGETRYCLSLENRMYVISQIEKITHYNELIIHKKYVDNIKQLFDRINSRIKDGELSKVSCDTTTYSEAIRLLYSNNEKLYEKGLLLLFEDYKAGNTEQSLLEINKHLPISNGEFLGIAGNKILFLQRQVDRGTGGRLLFKTKSINGTEKLLYDKKTVDVEKYIKFKVLEQEPHIYVLFEDDFILQLYCYDSENESFERKSSFSVPSMYGELFLEKKSEKEILWGIYNYFDMSCSIELRYLLSDD